jgi:predicted dehydrogenase
MKVGVLGVGHLGSLHARILTELPGVTLKGVFDLDPDKGAKIAAECGTTSFSSVEELLSVVDGAIVATSTSAHYEVASQALESGKHVFVEKPITSTVAEAELLIDLARRNGSVLQVGHVERFNPAILALEKYRIDPMFVESHRLAQFNPRGTDVAVVLDLMIHDIDIILSFVKSPVERIDANGVAVVSDSVDIANARIQFANGCVANVTGSRISQRRMRKMRLFQRREYISVDFSDGVVEVFRLLDTDEPAIPGTTMVGELGTGTMKKRIVYEQPEVKDTNALKVEMEMFLHSVQSGSRPVVDGDDGKRALEVAQTIMGKISQQRIPT